MLAGWLLFLAGAQQLNARDAQLFTRVHPAMGTDFTLYIYVADGTAADREAERVFSIVDQLDALLSNYQPQSELSRINNEAASHAVTTDPETFRFLKESLGWSARSDGAFDITVGKLMKAWGFFRSTGHVPSDVELAKVRAETGWKRVVLDAGTRTVRFTTAGVELDPGGIGKGFAVDAAVDALRADGVKAALLSAGSSTIYGVGAPPDAHGWKVRVPDPNHKGGAISTVVWIYGTEGSVSITIEDATFYYEPKTHPKPAVTGGEVVTHGITTGASYSTEGEMPYRGPGEKLAVTATEDPTLTACRSFIECVRACEAAAGGECACGVWVGDCCGDCESRCV